MALIVLGIIGLVAYLGDDPSPKSSRIRMIPGSTGGQTIDFALSPDGKWVATTSSDGWASLRSLGDDSGTGRILEPRRGLAQGLAFSPDGQTLALGRDPTGILVLDLAGGGPGIPHALPLSLIKALAFSPDGRTLAASTQRDGEIVLWDLDASRVRQVTGPPLGREPRVLARRPIPRGGRKRGAEGHALGPRRRPESIDLEGDVRCSHLGRLLARREPAGRRLPVRPTGPALEHAVGSGAAPGRGARRRHRGRRLLPGWQPAGHLGQ